MRTVGGRFQRRERFTGLVCRTCTNKTWPTNPCRNNPRASLWLGGARGPPSGSLSKALVILGNSHHRLFRLRIIHLVRECASLFGPLAPWPGAMIYLVCPNIPPCPLPPT